MKHKESIEFTDADNTRVQFEVNCRVGIENKIWVYCEDTELDEITEEVISIPNDSPIVGLNKEQVRTLIKFLLDFVKEN